MNIIEYVKEVSDIYGVANLEDNKDELVDYYGEDICIYPYAIVIGHKMLEEIIEKIPLSYSNDDYAQEYLDEYYNSHQRILKITEKISDIINQKGYDSIILDVSGNNERLNLKRPFSNKTSANLAGVGWLGKNNLLTTEEFGPRLTWATILTNAPLDKYVGTKMDSLCGDCNICVKSCPGNAIKNLKDPKKSYSPEKCGEYLMKRKDEGRPIACGMCLFVCPYGNKKINYPNGDIHK